MVKIPMQGNHFDRMTMHCSLNYINFDVKGGDMERQLTDLRILAYK